MRRVSGLGIDRDPKVWICEEEGDLGFGLGFEGWDGCRGIGDRRTDGRAVRARIDVGGRRRIVPRCAWGVGGRKFGRGRT